jgi:hypothetical protein
MAEKVLATVTIVQDNDSNDVTYTTHEIPGIDYKIVINVAEDLKQGARESDIPAIVAHELGHVLSDLFGAGKKMHARTSKIINKFPKSNPQVVLDKLTELPGFVTTILPEEHEAWIFAEKMTNVPAQLRKMALSGYERAAERSGPATAFDAIMRKSGLED